MTEDARRWAGPAQPCRDFAEFADREAIKELAKVYALGLDLRDYDLARSAFAPDAVTVSDKGREPIDESLPKTYAVASSFHATQHLIGNQYVAVDGDEATVWSYGVAHHKVAPGGPGDDIIAGVQYRDRCRRHAGGWLIAERQVVLQWMDRGPPPKPSA
jgi:hypothetical protein